MAENSGGEGDKSDSDIIEECERELQSMVDWNRMETDTAIEKNLRKYVEKRTREESEENTEEEFTTVDRRRPKRLIRSNSAYNQNGASPKGKSNIEIAIEVCVTSLERLPKQMALAKLLKTEKIEKILRIKYKNPYKVIIQFENTHQAEELLKNPKFRELGYRCQKVLEPNLSYGVVKGVDLEMEEKEISNAFESSYEIISVKRLKRLNDEGKWIDSEAVRICFNNPTVPSYILVYGCRFKVERYIFPVTQCSGCWKFGHSVKFCPIHKKICPKCGNNHDNCDLKQIKCLNCKGAHIVLDRTCPIFLKEKKIRNIMSEENITYRKALQIYLNETKHDLESFNVNADSQSIILPTTKLSIKPTYSDIVSKMSTKAAISHQEDTDPVNTTKSKSQSSEKRKNRTKNKTRRTPNTNKNESQNRTDQESTDGVENFIDSSQEENEEEDEEQLLKRKKRKVDLKNLLIKLKDIILSNVDFETKVLSIFRILFDACKSLIVSVLTQNNVISSVFDLFNG